DDTYCAGCHAPIAADHYTVNAWPSIAKGMTQLLFRIYIYQF
ncbi:hypothetical protein AB0S07_21115, partial [Escherichia coli]